MWRHCLCNKCRRRALINICYYFNQSSDSFAFPVSFPPPRPPPAPVSHAFWLLETLTPYSGPLEARKPTSDISIPVFQKMAENKRRLKDQKWKYNYELCFQYIKIWYSWLLRQTNNQMSLSNSSQNCFWKKKINYWDLISQYGLDLQKLNYIWKKKMFNLFSTPVLERKINPFVSSKMK